MCRRGDHSSRSSFGASPICFDLSRAWVAGLVDAYSNKKRTTLKGTAAFYWRKYLDGRRALEIDRERTTFVTTRVRVTGYVRSI